MASVRCVPGRAEIYASINALSRREDLPGAYAHQGMQPAIVMRGSRCWQVAKTVLRQGYAMWGEVGIAKYTDSSARDRKPAASICTGRTWSAQDETHCHKAERWWQHGLTTGCCMLWLRYVFLLHSVYCVCFWGKSWLCQSAAFCSMHCLEKGRADSVSEPAQQCVQC